MRPHAGRGPREKILAQSYRSPVVAPIELLEPDVFRPSSKELTAMITNEPLDYDDLGEALREGRALKPGDRKSVV